MKFWGEMILIAQIAITPNVRMYGDQARPTEPCSTQERLWAGSFKCPGENVPKIEPILPIDKPKPRSKTQVSYSKIESTRGKHI